VKNTQAHYDGYDYTLYWKDRDYEHASEALALASFFARIGKQNSIADIGCGFGRLTPLYRKFAKHIYLVEPSRDLLTKARTRLKFSKKNTIHYVQGTVENFEEKIKPVDTLMMIRVMHHIKDADSAINALSQKIIPGGHLILEFANKLHGKAQIKELLKGNILYPFDIFPNDRRSRKNRTKEHISFYNYHPDIIDGLLKKYKLEVIERRSVSNIRSSRMKKYIPYRLLLFVERWLQKPLASLHFGPSIFILATKNI